MNRRLSASDFAKWTAQVPEEWNVDRLGNVAQILFSNVDMHTINDRQDSDQYLPSFPSPFCWKGSACLPCLLAGRRIPHLNAANFSMDDCEVSDN